MENIIKKNLMYNYEILKNDLDNLKNKYNFFEVGNIGKSVLGEEIKYLKLGKGENKVFINASHHANEWISSLIIMLFVENYLELKNNNVDNYKTYNINNLWNNSTLYVVPMVNPDGVNLVLGVDKLIKSELYKDIWGNYVDKLEYWKANIRGVDLNLNYPFGFEQAKINKAKKGIINPGPRDYVGPNSLSEPEVIAMYNFTKLKKFDISISLHSQGKEIYWDAGKNKLSTAYNLGKFFEKVSGYLLTKPDYNSSFAGYKDWSVHELQNIGYTIELGKGEEGKSLSLSNVDNIYYEVEEIFLKVLETNF